MTGASAAGAASVAGQNSSKGYKNKKAKPINRESVSQDWTFRDKALFRRGLVKYGASFTEIAMMIGTKTYTIVKDYYKSIGGGKTVWIKPLLLAHTRMKKQNKLDDWPIVLSEAEEAAALSGNLRTC